MLGLMTPEVTQGFRDVFRVLRYVSDMLGEIASGHPRADDGGYLLRGFTGRDNNTQINFAYYRNGASLSFQSGDVILVRGQAHNSAAIARIGDVDSQFSHIGIVYIDQAGEHWMAGHVRCPLGPHALLRMCVRVAPAHSQRIDVRPGDRQHRR